MEELGEDAYREWNTGTLVPASPDLTGPDWS